MEKSVLDTICASLDNFFESERKIGTYIIQNTAKVVDRTVGAVSYTHLDVYKRQAQPHVHSYHIHAGDAPTIKIPPVQNISYSHIHRIYQRYLTRKILFALLKIS